MPTPPTPTLLNRLLRRLWDRRRVVAAVAIGVPLLRRLLFGAGAGAPIPSRLFSSFLEDIENDRVKACGITAEFFQVQLTDDAAKRVGGTLVLLEFAFDLPRIALDLNVREKHHEK